ncbi:hypothetical protein FACS1894113_1090 [Alphaproteobacteria bacterium]|nr:hypothetical protein FACS1894113_1090 [Alphaproteobacteria bacterium]
MNNILLLFIIIWCAFFNGICLKATENPYNIVWPNIHTDENLDIYIKPSILTSQTFNNEYNKRLQNVIIFNRKNESLNILKKTLSEFEVKANDLLYTAHQPIITSLNKIFHVNICDINVNVNSPYLPTYIDARAYIHDLFILFLHDSMRADHYKNWFDTLIELHSINDNNIKENELLGVCLIKLINIGALEIQLTGDSAIEKLYSLLQKIEKSEKERDNADNLNSLEF